MVDDSVSFPNEKDLEKELGDYLSNKYGGRVKIISSGMLPVPMADESGTKAKAEPSLPEFTFDLKPQELVDYLDEYVVCQDQAKAALATKICTHFNRIRRELAADHGRDRAVGRIKANVLLIGPTGVGKTYLVKLIARRLGVPFVKGDATKFSETGYVGGDVEDLVRELVREADDDIRRAEFGIIYVDEVDKIAGSPLRMGADVSRGGVQRAFLKPMEETEVELKVPHDPVSQMEAMEHYRSTGKREKRVVNTRNILFIMSGAFAGLADIIQRRTNRRSMGFGSHVAAKGGGNDALVQVKAEDLIEFGFESEFVGRLPVVTSLQELTAADFVKILSSPNSTVVMGKKQDFQAYDLGLAFAPEVFYDIAELAVQEKTGARGLVSVMERLLIGFEKSLPSTAISHLVVVPELVADPEGYLASLLTDEELVAWHSRRYGQLRQEENLFLQDFINRRHATYLYLHDVTLNPERLAMIARHCQDELLDVHQGCEEFVDCIQYIHGYADTVSDECGLVVGFSELAIDRLLAMSNKTIVSINSTCDKVFAALDYGLRLLGQKGEDVQVEITPQGVVDPDNFIADLLDESYKL